MSRVFTFLTCLCCLVASRFNFKGVGTTLALAVLCTRVLGIVANMDTYKYTVSGGKNTHYFSYSSMHSYSGSAAGKIMSSSCSRLLGATAS